MKAAIVRNGVVENIVVIDEANRAALGARLGADVINIDGLDAGAGYTTSDGATFNAPEAEEYKAYYDGMQEVIAR